MPSFAKKLPYGLNNADSKVRKFDIVENPSGNRPIPSHPFIFSPEQSSELPMQKSIMPIISKQPINSLSVKSGGMIDTNLFNIDFNKKKSRKKVILKFD